MGVSSSKPSGRSSGPGREVAGASLPTPRDQPSSRRSGTQSNSHLSHLGALGRNRPGTSSTGVAALQPVRQSLPSPGQAVVTDVLKFVRETYYKPNMKSGNKVKGEGGDDELRRQKMATQEVIRIRKQDDPVAAAMAGKAHQCGELTDLAIHHLQKRHIQAQCLSLGEDEEGDALHEVAIIGPASNPLPVDMTEWHPDVYVCDPWANIACSARDYPKQFEQKMKKWQDAGKLIGCPPEGFVPPNNEKWVNGVLHSKKKALGAELQ